MQGLQKSLGAASFWGFALCSLVACGGGGSSTTGSGGGNGSTLNPLALGYLSITGSSPSEDATQVALRPELVVHFDASVETGTFNSQEFALSKVGESKTIEGSFSTRNNGRSVVFVPNVDLEKATDYVYVVAPTVVDTDFRATDREFSIHFRTVDDCPPQLLSSSVLNNATGVSRTNAIQVTFDERLAEASLAPSIKLSDPWGSNYDVIVTQQAGVLSITPAHDLPGNASFLLSIRGGPGGISDRAGNRMAKPWSISFRTENDGVAPNFIGSRPLGQANHVSPLARIALQFDESIDEASFDPSGLLFQDANLNAVPFSLTASRDHKIIYLKPEDPLEPNASYTITLESSVTGLSDFSGNALAHRTQLRFSTGDDTEPPSITTSCPAANATRISPNVVIDLDFDAAIEPSTVTRKTVTLSDGTHQIYITPALSNDKTRLSVIPSKYLEPNTSYTLRLHGSYDGIQDLAGNPLDTDYLLRFSTSSSTVLPEFVITPGEGTYSVPTNSHLSIVANQAIDPSTVNSSTVLVEDSVQGTVPGTLSVTRANRCIVFTPTVGFSPGSTVHVKIIGEAKGLRLASGNWPTRDTCSSFSIGFSQDAIAPEIDLTLNEINKARQNKLLLPGSSFTIDVDYRDSENHTADPASLSFQLKGPGSVPGSDELFANGSFGSCSGQILIDPGIALDPGHYTLTATVSDSSGNTSTPAKLGFDVVNPSQDLRPFERMQIVWVRFDMDREGKGKGDGVVDFDQDLYLYGLMSKGDPSGTNARIRSIIQDGIVRTAHLLYGRSASGSPQAGCVPIRFVRRKPSSAPHMRIAVGGYDPDGSSGRKYGDESSGILGRAYYDYRNSNPAENNTGTSPGLGVFPRELYLYQTRLHLDLYPFYLTTFARSFRPLSPDMGGTPAGKDPLDKTVLSSSFVYNSATAAEKARYDEVMNAADDLATALGVILAHECGHSLGLTAPEPCPKGLHGDSSLHNSSTSFTDIMSAVISYESLVTVDFAFRPLNLAYLRERILTK
ncbi:MAG: hypothetical protein CSA62_06940 [Planctomycetota bacterium]|nr:MAG: hypothetical protein CSA62_06940 [Planctomycetota bacterium]